MKILGLLGSLFLFFWFVGMGLLTWHNVSRWLFGQTYENEAGVRFWMRQFLIIIWPLAICSKQGLHAIKVIWTGRDDITPPGRPDLDVEGDGFRTEDSFPRSSNRRKW